MVALISPCVHTHGACLLAVVLVEGRVFVCAARMACAWRGSMHTVRGVVHVAARRGCMLCAEGWRPSGPRRRRGSGGWWRSSRPVCTCMVHACLRWSWWRGVCLSARRAWRVHGVGACTLCVAWCVWREGGACYVQRGGGHQVLVGGGEAEDGGAHDLLAGPPTRSAPEARTQAQMAVRASQRSSPLP